MAKNKLALAAALLVSLAAVASSCAVQEETGARVREDTEAGVPEDAALLETSDAPQPKKASFDPSDERQIVGGSTDVFFGRVVQRTGSEKAPPIGRRGFREPQTQYAVKVTRAIKGQVSGTITVNRRGGSPEAPGGGSLLERGREHLFATKYVKSKGWYQIIAPRGGVVEVEDAAHRRELGQRFEEALGNQIEVNIPLPPATPEEVDKLEYRPCWPDKSGLPGCDPSDPAPTSTQPNQKGKPPSKEMPTSKTPQDTK
ncbi:MAG: hypothetical protein M3N18_07510 [Actinomycetota bacterium]|nr:hypothetical protein [Actinomycetota bacterium]